MNPDHRGQSLSIREFGLLSDKGEDNGLDYRKVSSATWRELRDSALGEVGQESGAQFLRLTSSRGVECVQVCNYVGLIQTSDGCQIEILPKTSILPKATNDSVQTTEAARKLLWRMLQTVFDIKDVRSGDASLGTLNRNWLEVLILRALNEISRLVRRGICSSYIRRVEQSRFLKGQLQVSRQLRLGPGRQDRFCVSYDQYLPERAENRLIHSALNKLSRWTRLPDNQRLCRELLFVFSGIPQSGDVKADLALWSDRRDMAHYQPVHPWVKLILDDQSPLFAAGPWEGVSMLFPMEQLFEKYVARKLYSRMKAGYSLKEQIQNKYLVTHKGEGIFRLKPDLAIKKGDRVHAVLDTKWKLIDQSDRKSKYNIGQADMYQLYAYGQKYLNGEGDLFLIYPKHDGFLSPLPVFEFGGGLNLWVVPFDLDKDALVAGEWSSQWMGFPGGCTPTQSASGLDSPSRVE